MGFLKRLRDKAVSDYSRAILQCVEHNTVAKILDLGCDDGHWTRRLGSTAGSSDLHGVEVVADAIAKARLQGVQVTEGDLDKSIALPDYTFDVIHANQVIEHLAATELFVTEVFRLLKPGGYAIICTENLSSWHNIASLLFGYMPMSSTNFSAVRYNVGNPYVLHANEAAELPKSWQHVRVLSYAGLRDIFTLHGFAIEKIVGSGYYPLPSLFGRLDPVHAAFLTMKARKPAR